MNKEMLEDLLFRADETCPYCGGVHLSIEEKDALRLRDDQTDRCNLTGPFTVPRLSLRSRLLDLMAETLLGPAKDNVTANNADREDYIARLENALWDFFQTSNRVCSERDQAQPMLARSVEPALYACTVRHQQVLNELAAKKDPRSAVLDGAAAATAVLVPVIAPADTWEPVRSTYGTLYTREDFVRMVADGEVTSNNGTAVPCKYIDERLHQSTPVHIQLLPLKQMPADVTHINFTSNSNRQNASGE